MFASYKIIITALSFTFVQGCLGQIGGLHIGANKPYEPPPHARYFTFPPDLQLAGPIMGLDLRLRIKEEIFIVSYSQQLIDELRNPDLHVYSLAYRMENLQVVRRKYVVTEIVDVGLGLNRMISGIYQFNFLNRGFLPHLNLGYGLLTSNGSFGIRYGILLTLPRKYVDERIWNYHINGKSKSFFHQLSLLYYPVIRFKKKDKPNEIRRRNR